ncbi:hypothetical protein GH721_08955 [Kriegella sp. EG-1]|nr:hypothetical protein [Flavobacteriaceae bacterium EG-1]
MMKRNECFADLLVSAFPSDQDKRKARTSKCMVFGETDSVNIRVGVFFDGTGNNKFNTEARLEYEKDNIKHGPLRNREAYIYQQRFNEEKSGLSTMGTLPLSDKLGLKLDKPVLVDDSYSNYYSNVAILFKHYDTPTTNDESIGKVYVEGIGTKKYESDDSFDGKGRGTGKYGITTRVNEACDMLAKEVKRLASVKTVFELKIDVFGFSRGAAAARNFIHEITLKEKDEVNLVLSQGAVKHYPKQYKHGALGEALEKEGLQFDGELEIVFAGLFDTVPSFYTSIKNYRGDKGAEDLNLNAISKAKNVLHLTAMDERRKNFALVDISSKGSKYEKALPGVHSDIGGGYNPKVPEAGKIIYEGFESAISREIQSVIEQGWYANKEQLKRHTKPINNKDDREKLEEMGLESLEYGYLEVVKKVVCNKYSFIPLHLMKMKGDEIRKGMFTDITEKAHEIPKNEEVLNYTYKRLQEYVIENKGGPMKFYTEEELGLDDIVTVSKDPIYRQKLDDHYYLKELRQKYFHTSHDLRKMHKNSLHPNWDTMFFYPFKPSINDKPSREIIRG